MKKKIKKFLRRGKTFKNSKLPKFFISRPFMSGLYYLIFSSQFRREQHAVLAGKVKYLEDVDSELSSRYILNRNIHRIEKGLLMRPRRDVFALDYIEETVRAFLKVNIISNHKIEGQSKWYYDVLNEYFASSGKHPLVDKLANIFKKNCVFAELRQIEEKDKYIPYFRHESTRPTISYEDFYQLTKYRRSVRWFQNKPVPRELIDKAVLAAIQSPSACNRQPFEYRVVDDADLLKKVIALPMGVRGYAEGIPVLVIVIGNLDAYFDERDRHLIYIDASLANMTLMLALETLGLGSCSINWPDIEEREMKMKEVLRLESHQRPVMCLAIGYPDEEGMVAYSAKREIEEIRKFN